MGFDRRQRLPSATYHSPGDETWTRDVFADQQIAIHASQHATADIARHVAENQLSRAPFFVMDVPAVVNAVDQWQSHMDRFTPFYALRCNADPVLAKLLAETQGMGFEVVNERELDVALSLVDPSMIIYSCPLWMRSKMRLAGSAGVGTIVVSSEKELRDAAQLAPGSKILLAVSFPGCPVRDEAYGANSGCPIEEAIDLLRMTNSRNFAGFSFNVDNTDTSVYFQALKGVKELWILADEYGLCPDTIAVGGGFRVPKQDKNHFHEVCRDLHDAVEEYFPQEHFRHLNLVATPGRFFAAAAFSLCTNVIGKREVEHFRESKSEAPFYVYQTNEGVYGAFGCRLADCEPECRPLLEKYLEEQESLAVIMGSSLDNLDVARKTFRSRQLSVGEWLLWENMGAYSMPKDDDCPAHPIYYFTGKDNWELINKRRQSFTELETISDIGSDGASEILTDDEEDRDRLTPFDNFFPY